MELVGKFAADEILNLKLAAVRVFNLVAGIDGKIDKKEITAFEHFIKKIRHVESNLAKEIFLESPALSSLEEARKGSGLSDREGLRYISSLIDRKLDHQDSIEFKQTLIAIGYYVAISSGSLFQHKVSEDESSVLNLIGNDLNMSFRELLNSHQMHRIIESISE